MNELVEFFFRLFEFRGAKVGKNPEGLSFFLEKRLRMGKNATSLVFLCIFAVRKNGRKMSTALLDTNSTIERITFLVAKLAAKQRQELEKQLELMLLWEEARRLDNSIKENNITMRDIVEEVKRARHGQ